MLCFKIFKNADQNKQVKGITYDSMLFISDPFQNN